MRRTIISILIATIVSITSTYAQAPSRARSCCGLMNGKIYCFGGDLYSTSITYESSSGMNVLDLTNSSGKLATNLQDMWQSVSYNINNVDFTSRTDAQCIVLEDGKHMVVNGGYDAVRSGQLVNLNIVYSVDSNEWNALPDYTEPPYGRRQIYYGSATNIPGKGVAFYGGYEEHINFSWSIPSTGNLSVFDFVTPPTSRYVGYSQVAMFQYENKANPWRVLAPLQDGYIATELSAGQMSVFDPVSNHIIFMGGGYRRNSPPASIYIPRPFNNISAVNVSNSHWKQLFPTGELPQPKRVYATTTLLPRTNRHVLLFGGEIQDGDVCSDYCFILNLDTYTWKKHVIAAPFDIALRRSRHSAVLVNDDTLFIMGGRDINNVGINSILILNVSDPENIVLSNKYVDPNAPTAAVDSENNTATNDNGSGSSAGLTTGAKAGIAVACVGAAVMGLVSIWFFFRNKKSNEKIRQQQQEISDQQQHQENDVVPMEVDWDRIENKYTEIPPVYTFQNTTNRSISFNTNTLVGESEPIARAVLPDGVQLQNPHTEDVHSPLQPNN